MAITGSTLGGMVYASYIASIPTAASANRSNSSLGIVSHNVPYELSMAISKGFCTALLSMQVFDTYTGVLGPGSAVSTPAPPIFNAGIIETASATFLGSMGWSGAYSVIFADIMIDSLFQHVSSISQIQMNTLTAAGPGVGNVTAAVNPTLAATMSSLCATTIISEITSTNKFNQGDIIGGSPTDEIALLATNLSIAYGTVVGAVTSTVPYVGVATTPTSALSMINSGKFI